MKANSIKNFPFIASGDVDFVTRSIPNGSIVKCPICGDESYRTKSIEVGDIINADLFTPINDDAPFPVPGREFKCAGKNCNMELMTTTSLGRVGIFIKVIK